MDATLSITAGSVLVLAGVAGGTSALSGNGRRGPGRIALALVWTAVAACGATAVAGSLAPGHEWIWTLGLVLVGSCGVSALVLALQHRRDVRQAKQRDAELGEPPRPSSVSLPVVVSACGLAAVALSLVLVAPWMLVLASTAGVPATDIVHGLVSNVAMTAPVVWIILVATTRARMRRRREDHARLQAGIDSRVDDADQRGYRRGYTDGREEGYRNAAFGSIWDEP